MRLPRADAAMYFSAKDFPQGSTTDITFADEGEIVEKEYDGEKKSVFEIGIKAEDAPNAEKMSISSRLRNDLIDLLGEDTAKWINQTITLVVVSYPTGNGFVLQKAKKKK